MLLIEPDLIVAIIRDARRRNNRPHPTPEDRIPA